MEDIVKKKFYNTQIPTYKPEELEIFYDEPAADNTLNELTQLNNVEFHIEAVTIEEVEINSNLSVNSGFDVTPIESPGPVYDNLDLGIDVNVDIETKKSLQCQETQQILYLDDPLFIKEKERKSNSDLLNLNARGLLSNWRERIKSNLLYCKDCTISFTKIDELRYHNNSVHNFSNTNKSSKLLTTVDTSVQELNNEIVIKNVPDKVKNNKVQKEKFKKQVRKRNIKSVNRYSSSKRIIVKEGVLFCKSGFKTFSIAKTGKDDDFETVKYKEGVKRRAQNSLTKSPFITDDILETKGYIQINSKVPIADIMVTLKEKDGKKRKVHALDSDGNLLKIIKKTKIQ